MPHLGVNPRGLVPNELWQVDVTHVPTFGSLKYLHVTIDTFGGFLFASAHSGEASKNVIAHVLSCIAVMGRPEVIKTDNGPGYTGRIFQYFCKQLQIKHITGIPYNPQGQGLVERAHQTLKTCFRNLTQTFYPSIGAPKKCSAPCPICVEFSNPRRLVNLQLIVSGIHSPLIDTPQ